MRLSVPWFLAAILVSAVPASAFAKIAVSTVIVPLPQEGRLHHDIEVRNLDEDKTSYVQTSVEEVLSAGQDNEQRVPVVAARDKSLLASPQKMVLPGGASKFLRVMLLEQPAQQERVFRVTVRPVVGGVETRRTAIKLLVAYEVLVLARPQQTQGEWKIQRDDSALKAVNNANHSVFLREVRQCDNQKEQKIEECPVLTSKRLYSGADWSYDLPANTPVSIMLETPQGTVIERY